MIKRVISVTRRATWGRRFGSEEFAHYEMIDRQNRGMEVLKEAEATLQPIGPNVWMDVDEECDWTVAGKWVS